jgi:hypothetical protein
MERRVWLDKTFLEIEQGVLVTLVKYVSWRTLETRPGLAEVLLVKDFAQVQDL